jgi:hypothetical protein
MGQWRVKDDELGWGYCPECGSKLYVSSHGSISCWKIGPHNWLKPKPLVRDKHGKICKVINGKVIKNRWDDRIIWRTHNIKRVEVTA